MAPPGGTGGNTAPIDRPILEFLQTHLENTRQVERAILSDESGHLELAVVLSSEYYPMPIDEVTLSIRWYENDDFTIHYQEEHPDHVWQCRWDRHPNPHNTRDHYHPPPDAGTPSEDVSWMTDYREVLRFVFDEIEERIAQWWNG